tara:strand:- start:112528 stop:113805 length:1278 start_codon:yes stop_codon:yes gene_type:complete
LNKNKNVVVVGAQWGDEGKGRIIDLLSKKFDIVSRFQGGSNAGHTIIIKNKKIILHHIPSGVLRNGKISVIGNGAVIDPDIIVDEIKALRKKGYKVTGKNLKISELAHLILPFHKLIDIGRETIKGKNAIGTTGRGIGPCYEDKISRQGIRFVDLSNKKILKDKLKITLKEKNKILSLVFNQKKISINTLVDDLMKRYKFLKEFIVNTEHFLNKSAVQGKSILFEGAQGVMLDIDFGTYPFVTSSSTISSNASSGTGVPFKKFGKSIGVSKAYATRVGYGPFPTEMIDDEGLALREFGDEYGATTGRPRRCGWLDLIALKHSVEICGLDEIVLTKVDILSMFKTINVCIAYKYKSQKLNKFPMDNNIIENVTPIYKTYKSWDIEDLKNKKLPSSLQSFIKYIEQFLNVKISMISFGPEREQVIYL